MQPSFIVPKASDALCVHSSRDGRFMYVGTSAGHIHVVHAMRGTVADTIRLHGIVRSIRAASDDLIVATTDTHAIFFMGLKYPPFLRLHAVAIFKNSAPVCAKMANDNSFASVTLKVRSLCLILEEICCSDSKDCSTASARMTRKDSLLLRRAHV